jgi:hypothetical protein
MKDTELEGIRFSVLRVSLTVFTAFFLVLVSASGATAGPDPAQAGSVPCLSTANTLQDLVQCIIRYMPNSYSTDGRDGFDVPTVTEWTQWREVIGQMMANKCETINLAQYPWGGDFTVTRFRDAGNNRTYCVFTETRYANYAAGARVTHGWGTFIYDPAPLRELSIGAPHARFESRTGPETIQIFEKTRSRTFVMTGAHRHASNVVSPCQDDYQRSDAAHNTKHMFHATIAELEEYYRSRNTRFYHLQFHSMRTTTCPGVNVYLTHGTPKPPVAGDKVLELRANLVKYNTTWKATVPGNTPKCGMHGGNNVQGALLNGVPAGEECSRYPQGYSGQFIHIEQQPGYDDANDWIAAIKETWTTLCSGCRPVSFLPLVTSSPIPAQVQGQ